MIKKYVFGNPFETYAVTEEKGCVEMTAADGDALMERSSYADVFSKYGGDSWDEAETVRTYRVKLEQEDVVYGLGENVRGINKRGWVYESKCSDDPNHNESKRSLYGAHNFIIHGGRKPYGIFVDYPGRIIFDIGYLDINQLEIHVSGENFTIYFIDAEAGNKAWMLSSIIRQFRQMIGKSYMPPRWAFGFQQSRWGYRNAEDITAVVENYQKHEIPIDAVYLDIDYMERYKDFTVDEQAFPDFPDFVEKMKEKHIHLVPIIDAGVKIEEGYETYETGVEGDFFCKDGEGKNFVAGVWPGKVHFPDVLNASARKWFGDGYQMLLNAGIDGFWNDMNEPAIFYSEKHLKEVQEELESYRNKNLDINSFFHMKDLVSNLSNNIGDYKSFYHQAEQPEGCVKVRHDHVHNLYGYNMTKAAGKAFDRLCPDKRILMFSRSSYIGMHRYGGIWTGDNHSWWSHILLTLKMLPSLNMCGFMYIGSDLGGFNDNATEDLVMRWLGLSIFVPLMRNHAAAGTRDQELYRFTDIESFRKLVKIRYGLIPYLYSEYKKAVEQNEMMYKPLGFVFPEDPQAVQTEDQLFVGESMMICPVYTQNAGGRYVYLPEDMTLVKMSSDTEYSLTGYAAGSYYIEVALNEVIFFIRKGHAVPLAKSAAYAEAVDISRMKLLRAEGERADYELSWDDGISK